MRQWLSRAPRPGVLAQIGWKTLGFGLMLFAFPVNAMIASALWTAWGRGRTTFFVSAGIAACVGGALGALGSLFEGTTKHTKQQILFQWLIFSWFCLCLRLSDRLVTENATWPYFICILIPAYLVFRSKRFGRLGGWMPRTIDEMRSGAPAHESNRDKDSNRS